MDSLQIVGRPWRLPQVDDGYRSSRGLVVVRFRSSENEGSHFAMDPCAVDPHVRRNVVSAWVVARLDEREPVPELRL